jgi:hypothetical protein
MKKATLTSAVVAADRNRIEADRALAEAVRRDSWYILGGIEARIFALTTEINNGTKSLETDDGSDIYRSLRNMLEEAGRIVKEYTEARDRLRAAGLQR